MSTDLNPWMNYLSNPKAHYVQKSMFQLLQDRYLKHQDIVERVGVSLLTEKDIQSFLQMAIEIYEIGYLKAVGDYKEQLEKMGIKATVVHPDQTSK
jgi:hypothetical protein